VGGFYSEVALRHDDGIISPGKRSPEIQTRGVHPGPLQSLSKRVQPVKTAPKVFPERVQEDVAPLAERLPTGSRYVRHKTNLLRPCPLQAQRQPLGERRYVLLDALSAGEALE